jgi:hypothetical protein
MQYKNLKQSCSATETSAYSDLKSKPLQSQPNLSGTLILEYPVILAGTSRYLGAPPCQGLGLNRHGNVHLTRHTCVDLAITDVHVQVAHVLDTEQASWLAGSPVLTAIASSACATDRRGPLTPKRPNR